MSRPNFAKGQLKVISPLDREAVAREAWKAAKASGDEHLMCVAANELVEATRPAHPILTVHECEPMLGFIWTEKPQPQHGRAAWDLPVDFTARIRMGARAQ